MRASSLIACLSLSVCLFAVGGSSWAVSEETMASQSWKMIGAVPDTPLILASDTKALDAPPPDEVPPPPDEDAPSAPPAPPSEMAPPPGAPPGAENSRASPGFGSTVHEAAKAGSGAAHASEGRYSSSGFGRCAPGDEGHR